MRRYVLVSGILFSLMAAVQLIRAVLRWPVIVNGVTVPVWASVVACLVVGTLAGWAIALLVRSDSIASRA